MHPNQSLCTQHLELSMLLCVQGRDTIVLPRRPDHASQARVAKLQLLRAFQFNSQSLKSGMLVTSDDTGASRGLLFVKGAHTAIKSLLPQAALPADFDQVVPRHDDTRACIHAPAHAHRQGCGRVHVTCATQLGSPFLPFSLLIVEDDLMSNAEVAAA